MEFRGLKPDEIEVRVGTVSKTGVSLLLYKNARCDMQLLDEVVGAMNWQRSHTRDNANCIVSIYDKDKKEWVSKEDTGTESNTEKEKGLASDSFKRACFCWGIGRELYTAPFIWISAETKARQGGKGYELTSDGKKQTALEVKEIEYVETDGSRKISKLVLVDKQGNTAFSWQLSNNRKSTKEVQKATKANNEKVKKEIFERSEWKSNVVALGIELGYSAYELAKLYGMNKDTTTEELKEVYKKLEGEKNAKHTTEQ